MPKIGFTGTQKGMTTEQLIAVAEYLCDNSGEFHYGDCIGADAQAHKMANETKYYKIIGHPPSNPVKRAWCTCHELQLEKPYLERNKDIVLQTNILIATPSEMEERIRSGTWSTIRFARRLDKPIIIFLPDGSKSN